MKRFISSIVLGCLASMLTTEASAQVPPISDGVRTVTPLSVKRFTNGYYISLVEQWNHGVSVNSMMYVLQNVNCQKRMGVLTLVSGNIGIEMVHRQLNYPVQFNDGTLLDKSVWAVCARYGN